MSDAQLLKEDLEADFIVLGSGLAGMTAAHYAASQGRKVVVIEKAPELGGSSVLSSAHLWTATSYESLRRECPRGDPELGAAFFRDFGEAVTWVRSSGVDFGPEIDVVHGRGNVIDVISFVEAARRAVEQNGGSVQVSTTVDHLLRDGQSVSGVCAYDRDGPVRIRAPWTLLATGGFQGSHAMLAEFFGSRSSHLVLRANSYSTGDGLRLGLSAGAAIRGPMDAFYGHLLAWPLARLDIGQLRQVSLNFSSQAVLVNAAGKRFTDESLGDHVNAQRTAEQPGGRALILLDQRLRRVAPTTRTTTAFPFADKLEDAMAAGARVATAGSWEDLGNTVRRWGFDGTQLPGTVAEYNQLVQRESPDQQNVNGTGRAKNRTPLGEGPYYAMEVRPGITFTQGGLSVDEHARVLDSSGRQVGGLLAAGADIGGLYGGGYAGGLAQAAVFGLKAARTATSANGTRRQPVPGLPDLTEEGGRDDG
jgi:succinate dehydrogenase/fumarate reductase flavoprotein subunit